MPHTNSLVTVSSPTQLLRDLIEDSSAGMATPQDLHDALTLLEQSLQMARTFPTADIEVAA